MDNAKIASKTTPEVYTHNVMNPDVCTMLMFFTLFFQGVHFHENHNRVKKKLQKNYTIGNRLKFCSTR